MNNIPPRLAEMESALSLSTLERYADGWILACEIDQHSHRTLGTRRDIIKKLLWFLRRRRCEACGVMELRSFFAYLTNGHKEPEGRWGNPHMTKPVSPRTVKDYHGHLRTLFRWIVAEDALTVSPMERIPVPTHREDQIETFTEEQINTLIAAAKRSRLRRRDEAILLFLLDTGVRASELCGLYFGDVDLSLKKATVEGKGRKSRPIYFGKVTAKALWNYVRDEGGREDKEALFQSERGDPLTRSGLQQLIERLGKEAKINGVRCSPHTFRHYFAITFLRNGGNQFTLMQLLGHTNLTMTARYVKIAQADAERQARQFSPADNLKRGKR